MNERKKKRKQDAHTHLLGGAAVTHLEELPIN